jgi:predicted metallopeptidase
MIEQGLAEDIHRRVKEIIRMLKMTRIDETRVIRLRSKGSVRKEGFGGGFRAHQPNVTTAKVQKLFEKFMKVNIDPVVA